MINSSVVLTGLVWEGISGKNPDINQWFISEVTARLLKMTGETGQSDSVHNLVRHRSDYLHSSQGKTNVHNFPTRITKL